jgi:hypothetical protein
MIGRLRTQHVGWRAMTTRMGFVALLMMLSTASARGEPMSKTRMEVHYLLDQIEASGCEFNGNGIWYGSMMASYHLSNEYEKLEAERGIRTAEDFIAMAAGEIDDSGQPFKVRCNDGKVVTSGQWLHDELVHFRSIFSSPPP